MTDRLEDSYDVVVLGGGAAGLNGAMMLARARRPVAVIDAGSPRNAPALGVHGLLGHDGLPPAELLERGRAEVRRYGGHVVAGDVAGAGRHDRGFVVTLADGRTTHARRLLVTTGLVDVLPEVPGVRERWGRDVLHCPYCHGWEVRDRSIGILATGPMSVHQALLFSQLSDDVTYVAHSVGPDEEQAEQLAARGIRVVVDREVAELEIVDDRVVGMRLRDGEVIGCEAVVVSPRMVARAGFLADLGLHTVEHPSGMGEHVPGDPTGRTDVPGVWVAGNVTDLSAQVGASAAAGAMAGAQINADLVMAETQHAVESRRAHAAHEHPEHPTDPTEFWEEFYGADRRPWSGRPNQVLVAELTEHPAPVGRALDLGCGAGADAIWLAQQGWQVTGLDISAAALVQAAAEAGTAGVTDRMQWVRHDLADGLPEGEWDLVAASYLHSPVELDREKVLRLAAGAVARGGTLLVIGHQGAPSWGPEQAAHLTFPTPDDVLAALDLDGWTVERAATVTIELTAPDGSPGRRVDNVVRVRRPD